MLKLKVRITVAENSYLLAVSWREPHQDSYRNRDTFQECSRSFFFPCSDNTIRCAFIRIRLQSTFDCVDRITHDRTDQGRHERTQRHCILLLHTEENDLSYRELWPIAHVTVGVPGVYSTWKSSECPSACNPTLRNDMLSSVLILLHISQKDNTEVPMAIPLHVKITFLGLGANMKSPVWRNSKCTVVNTRHRVSWKSQYHASMYLRVECDWNVAAGKHDVYDNVSTDGSVPFHEICLWASLPSSWQSNTVKPGKMYRRDPVSPRQMVPMALASSATNSRLDLHSTGFLSNDGIMSSVSFEWLSRSVHSPRVSPCDASGC